MSPLRPGVRGPWLLLLATAAAAGCGSELPACDRMCAAAAEVYGGCLDDWELDWQAAGYRGRADFEASCETWAWELQELEEDALKTGTLEHGGAVAEECRARHAVLSAPDASCESYTELDWSRAPWEAPTEAGTPPPARRQPPPP